jgi:CBS domain-containing protein
MNVGKLMSTDVRTCAPHHSLSCAAQQMWEGDFGCIPVVDDLQRIVGIITDRDICMAASLNGRAPGDLSVRDFMSHPVITCHPQDRLTDATAAMRQAQVRRLPVVEADGRLAGILSLADVAKHYAAAASVAPTSDEVGRTLGAVDQPRSPTIPLGA